MSSLYAHLSRYTSAEWGQAVRSLSMGMHPIDRDATRIWFSFFPLDLHLMLEAARREGGDDAEAAVARKLGLMGKWKLADQVDRSHRFLFAHRYWPQVKSAVSATTEPVEPLAALITAVADAATRTARVDRDLLLGMSAVGLMTLRQAGPEAFAEAPGHIHLSDRARARSPHQVLKDRARDDAQGVLGFLRGVRRRWTVTFDENESDATFPAIEDQELASAAQADKRDYRSRDPRCTPGEGPIPVECRAASCGTCWVGVLGGATKLSPVVERDEGRRMKVFGYIDTDEPQPIIRLSCQARVRGAVSVVIPPWNGITGRRP
ncbi:MAG TPA: 2Fe-2S iron-sulfur cluster-binding protein [Vicinamibacterales bacterium]|nr:2Fe-2S iron-sulfur cluster-binding protein [Vicinamibacterales bacterium]